MEIHPKTVLVFLVAAGLLTTRALSAPTWRMAVERNGVTNWVTASTAPKAVAVSFGAEGGGWCGRVVNRDPGTVVLGFEVMSDPQPVDDGKTALYLPYVYGWRIRNWPRTGTGLGGRKVWETEGDGIYSLARIHKYPGKFGTMQWCTLNDGKRGFYLGSDDPNCIAKDFRVTYDSRGKTVRMGFELPMFLPQGASFELPRLFFDGYDGDWKIAAKRYRAWWDSCRKVVRLPERIRDTVGCLMVILKQQNGEFVWPYGEFDSLGETAIAHGLYNVELHGWGVGGHDRLYPEYDPDPAMGGRDALMKGIAALKAKGLHVTLYSNGQLQQHAGTKWAETEGPSCPILLRDGSPLQERWVKYKAVPGVRFDVACPCSPAWRSRMLKICRDARELGCPGFFYDQIGKQWPWPCFDARHGHRAGAYVWQADRMSLFESVIAEMRKTDPDFILWSEAFNDTLLTSVACYQGLDYVRGDWCVENRFVRDIGCEMYPELTAYTFPELITTDRVTDPFCTRARANGCAVTNLRVDFEVRYPGDRWYAEKGTAANTWEYARISFPPFGLKRMLEPGNWKADRAYLKSVNDFRLGYRDILLRGTFRADEGFSLTAGEGVIANRWTGTNGEDGILVWNATDRPMDVKIGFAKDLIGCVEPEHGETTPERPVGANALRLYRYR